MPDDALVLHEGESDLGEGQRCQGQIMLDVGPLGFLAAQEFPARRQIVKQLAHFHAGAWRVAGGLHLEDFPAVNDDLRGFRRSAVAFAGG